MNIKSKVVVAFALAVFVLPVAAFAASAPTAAGTINAALEAQIVALTAQVKALQAQVAPQDVPPPGPPTGSTSAITIAAPTAGQLFTQGTYNKITWSGGASSVSLSLYNSTGQTLQGTLTASSTISNSGTYSWDGRTIYLAGSSSKSIATGSYVIKVADSQGDSATSPVFSDVIAGLPPPSAPTPNNTGDQTAIIEQALPGIVNGLIHMLRSL